MDWPGHRRARFDPSASSWCPRRTPSRQSRASKALLRAGTACLVVGRAIVLARAAFFEPGIYDSFSHVASLAKNLIF